MEEPTEIEEWIKVAQLGAGGFGIVTLWRNTVSNESFAIKKCKMGMASSLTSRQKERWRHEVEIMQQINNQNIVSFKELPEVLQRELNKYNPTKLPLLSMEYCSKGNLRTYLKSLENKIGLPEVEVRYILSDVSNAISYLHKMDITHRDIKPENIVMQSCDDRLNKMVYKVIDLGYAKELGTIVSFVGTLPYLAPEIFQTESYTKNVDYWSFGITTYEIITGSLPFLPTFEPPERFKHIKSKSENDICISISKKGKIEYHNQILQKTRISSVLKKHIEDWLRLVLQFDPKKRGIFRNQVTDVLLELKEILVKKIVKVLFVYNLTAYSYEVTENSTFGDLKKLIMDKSFALGDLVVVHESQSDIYDDHDKILECVNNIDHTTDFFIFTRKYIHAEKNRSFPASLEQLHTSRFDFKIQELGELTIQLIVFIRAEKELLEFFVRSVHAQIALTERMFDVFLSKKLFEKIRNDLTHLLAKSECYDELTNHSLRNSTKDKCMLVGNYRKLLRQIKELAENVNGMTEKFLLLTRTRDELTSLIDAVKKTLSDSKFDIFQTSAISLYQRIQQAFQLNDYTLLQNNSNQAAVHIDLARILSQLLRMWWKNIMTNEKMSKLTSLSLNLQKALKKHYTWCMALDKEIYRVSKELRENQLLIHQSITSVGHEEKSLVSVIFPRNCLDVLDAKVLMEENMDLRYTIQEKLDETALSLRKIQSEVLMLYNGVSMRYSDI